MKKISEDEFREYLEFKEFMEEVPAGAGGNRSNGRLSLDELDMVRAARGNQDFELFMEELRARKEREDG